MEGPVSALLVLDCSRLCCALCSEDYLIFFYLFYFFPPFRDGRDGRLKTT